MKRRPMPLEKVRVTAMDSVAILTATIPIEGSKGVKREVCSPIICVYGRRFQFEREMAIGEAMDLDTGEVVKLDVTRIT
jgi:hypothetical protein